MDHQGAVARGSARHLRGSQLGAAAARRPRVSGSAGVRAGGDRPHPHERADGGSPRRPADGEPGHLRAGGGPERRQLRDEGEERRARGHPVHERRGRPLGPVAGDLGDRVPELRRHRGGRGEPVRHRSERAPARELPPGVAPGDARSRRPDLSRLRRDRERDAVRERRLRPGSADRVRPGGRGLSRRAGQRRGRPDRRGLRGDRAADVHVRDPGRHAAGGGGGGGGAARAARARGAGGAAGVAERHVARGIECRQRAWAYSIPGFTDFDVVNWKFINRSGHDLDSVAIGFRVDMDCGPVDKSNYFSDDFGAPQYPYGRFVIPTPDADFRKAPKGSYPPVPDVDPDSALCPRMLITVQGFSVADDDGDDHKTTGVPHFLLIDHTIDPTGENGPRKVGFRAFRSFPNGQPYGPGAIPTIDQQCCEFLTSTENIANDPATPALNGFINAPPGDQKSDYSEWASIGPWLRWAPQAELEATVAIGVRTGDLKTALAYSAEYQSKASLYKIDPVTGEEIWAVVSGAELIGKYPALDNAIAAQLAFEGAYEVPHATIAVTDFPGRETPIRLPAGQKAQIQGCEAHDPAPRFVDSQHASWFDFDCDYCTR